ncbi:MAG: glycosyltransferase [Burkholderiaceae bacterium]
MKRTALMLAFYFPPFAQSTGGQRVLSFVRHLPMHGWHPVVLTARERLFPEIDASSVSLIPPSTEIVRAGGLDAARHLSIGGRYPRWIAIPDRWATWALAACWQGLSVVRARSPHVLWATFPIPSALLAAITLQRLTKLPLVIDLRDPVVYEHWPVDRLSRRVYVWLERKAVSAASKVVLTTPGARQLYIERYPELPSARFCVIANGVDDDAVQFPTAAVRAQSGDRITLVHSGLMEVPDRDPSAFFAALGAMRDRGEIAPAQIQVILRATGRDDVYKRQIGELALRDFVRVESRVSHDAAVNEMCSASGLLLFQGHACNRQIPAKAYEYLACRRPIVGFCDPRGDTHDLLARQWNVPYMADMNQSHQIEQVLRTFLKDCCAGMAYVPSQALVAWHGRSHGAQELAALFDSIVDGAARSEKLVIRA